jgi:hypothetical protein
MKCPNCGCNISDTLAKFSSKGGKASKRKITPEQQAKLQAARKAARDKKKGQAA